MLNSFKNGVKLCFIIVGTTIGAGFASGREIWEFFSSYGYQSIFGIYIAMILFAISSIFILLISYKYKTENYYEVLVILMGNSIARIFDGFIFLYLFSGSVIMFAGSGATFEQWNYPYLWGVVIIGILVWIVLQRGINGLMTLNGLVIPFLIIILIYVNYQFLENNQFISEKHVRGNLEVWPSAITYTALNLISLLGVLSTMGQKIKSQWDIVIGGGLAAFVLGVVALLLNFSLLKVEYVQQYEIPLFSLIPNYKSILLFVVSLALWLAIYTSVVSNIHGLVHRIQSKYSFSTGKLSLLLILCIFPLSFIGFSKLVEILYPLYGVINLYLLAVVILYPFQTSR